MGLQQVNKSILTSAASTIQVTGIDSDDPYKLIIRNLQPVDNVVYAQMRFIISGSVFSSSNYAYADKVVKTAAGFGNLANSSQDKILLSSEQLGTAGQEKLNGIFYIYNANDSAEKCLITQESVGLDSNSNTLGQFGGGVLDSAGAVEGVSIFFSSGNVAAGSEAILYKVV